MLHLLHVIERDDVLVARGRDDDVGPADGLLDRLHLEAVHQCLEGVDGVDLGDRDAGTLPAQRLCATLADVAVTADERGLAADQHVGAAVDAVEQRVAGAVLVVELALGDRVVDVDGREDEFTGSSDLVQTQDTGRGLLGDALDRLRNLRPLGLVCFEGLTQQGEEHLVLVGILVVVGGRYDARLLELRALEDEHRASPPSSRIMFAGLSASGQVSIRSAAHQYSSSVSPFHAKTGVPCGSSGVPWGPTTIAAAA